MVTLQKVQPHSQGSRKKLGREYIKKVAGGLFYKSNFCFCLDGTAVCLVSGDTFTVYQTYPLQQSSTRTNHVQKYFISKSHDKRVTRVVSHPLDTAVVMSASEDGTLRIWDIEEGVLQKTIDIGLPIEHCLYDTKFTDTVYCLCKKLSAVVKDTEGQQQQSEQKMQRTTSRSRKLYKVISVQMNTGKVSTLFQLKRPRCFCLVSSEHALLVGSDYGLNCYFLEKKDSRVLHIPHIKPISAMAYHEETDTLAIGEDTGMIRIFRGFMAIVSKQNMVHPIGSLNTLAHSKFHWHSKIVLSLAFSVNGVRIFSGGMEGVLVSWKCSTGEHTFLPRLGGSIRHLMVESNRNVIGVSTHDNCFKLLDGSNGDLVWEVRGPWSWTAFRPDKRKGQWRDSWKDFIKCFWTANGTPKLFLPGRTGRLQIFDIAQDRHWMEVELYYFNYLPTCTEDAKCIPFVSHLCITRDMSSIITLERRFEDYSLPLEFSAQVIHFYELQSSHYVLQSRMYIQSKDSFIVDIFCHPYAPFVGTLHRNGSFRIWARKTVSTQEQQSKWYCIHRWNGHPTATVIRGTFSNDASLLVIGYDNLLSFWKWEEKNISLLSEKSFDVGYIESLHCLGGNCGILVVTTASSFLVIDLIQMEMLWSQHVVEPMIACDDSSSRFAVVCLDSNGMKHHKIYIYEPCSIEPLYILDAKGIFIKQVFFELNHFDASFDLVLVDHELQIYRCQLDSTPPIENSSSINKEKEQYNLHDGKDSAYFRILGEDLYRREAIIPQTNTYWNNNSSSIRHSNKMLLEFQDVPSHVLPTPQELLNNIFHFHNNDIPSQEQEPFDDLETNLEKPWSGNAFPIDEKNRNYYGQRLWKKLARLNKSDEEDG